MKEYSNHLAGESSPYLLQHAHNPVDWYPWGQEAFAKAAAEDKPVLLSIGYAACHWCHVMAHESFESDAIAEFMNRFFICIKVDREERPDIDQIYMQACQLLTGAGGWPLNVFLTPDKKPFTGGTYFPPKPMYGKPSWMEVLTFVQRIFSSGRDKVMQQAEMLSAHMQEMESALFQLPSGDADALFPEDALAKTLGHIMRAADLQHGGFGQAPKFPSTQVLLFLLRGNFFRHEDAVAKHCTLTLDRMREGGMFDQLGGGFCRYSVDAEWQVPHFEKMLYDNALLTALYAEAFQITGDKKYLRVAEEIIGWVQREMRDPSGGYYASLDADSEGEEGKFYTWTESEVDAILGEDAAFAKMLFGIRTGGNWEGVNILHRAVTEAELAVAFGVSEKECGRKIAELREKLFTVREKRVRPGRDEKIILCWNALWVSGLLAAFRASGNKTYLKEAGEALAFLRKTFTDRDAMLLHVHTAGQTRFPAFLDDHAALIRAFADYYLASGEPQFLHDAVDMCREVIAHFASDNGLFYYTHRGQEDVLFRSREVYDQALPSGNALMAGNLLMLSALAGENTWEEMAMRMLRVVQSSALEHPQAFGHWLLSFLLFRYPRAEVAVTGPLAGKWRPAIWHHYYPHILLQCDADGSQQELPLLRGRYVEGESRIYLCRNFVCHNPVMNPDEFFKLLERF